MPNLGYKNTDDAQRMGNEVRHRRKRVKPGQHESKWNAQASMALFMVAFARISPQIIIFVAKITIKT